MKIFFHLGYPRTGTTFLQKRVFKDNKINFIGRTSNYGRQDKYFYQTLFQIMDLSNDQYNKEKKKILSMFKKINFSKNKINLISEEGVMCQYSWRNNNIKTTLKRLIEVTKMTNFDISFFLTIRNQQDCIVSNFQYFYSSYFYKHYSSLEKFVNSKDSKKKKVFDSFNYFKIFKLFKEENLKLNFFLYEDIFSKNAKFMKKFSNYLNIKIKTKNNFKKVNSKNDLYFKYRKYNFKSKNLKNLFNLSILPARMIKSYDLVKKIYLDKKINKTKIDNMLQNNIKQKFIKDNKKLNKRVKLTKDYL